MTDRGRWAPHEIGMVLLGFVLPLDGAKAGFLAEDRTRVVALVLAVGLLVARVARDRLVIPRPGAAIRAMLPVLCVYTVVLMAATFSRSLPTTRVQLLAPLVVAIFGVWVCESARRGSWVDVVYRVALGHILLALVTRTTEVSAIGVTRLTGATTAVLLGLEAACVFIVALTRWRLRIGRYPGLSLALLPVALVTLALSFSRTSLVSFTVAAVVFVAFRTRRHRAAKLLGAVVAGLVFYRVFSGPIVNVLGGNSPESLRNATGRYELWDTVIHHSGQHWRGYGFSALRDGLGPDADLYSRTKGLSTESSPLHAWLMAGWVGLGLWVLFAGRVARAAWSHRNLAAGVTVFLGIVVGIEALYGVGMSGQSSNVWWVFALPSLCDLLRSGLGTDDRAVRRARRGAVLLSQEA